MSYEIPIPPNVSTQTLEPHATILQSFMSSFYAISDNPTAHEKYAGDYFASDATLIMGGKGATGYDEILSLRKSLWTKVSARKHTPQKIFFGGERDLMIFGKVAYVMRDSGKEIELDWAARAEFVFDDDEISGKPRMRYYQVYLDTAAQMAAAN